MVQVFMQRGTITHVDFRYFHYPIHKFIHHKHLCDTTHSILLGGKFIGGSDELINPRVKEGSIYDYYNNYYVNSYFHTVAEINGNVKNNFKTKVLLKETPTAASFILISL